MRREVDGGMASVMHYLKFALLTFQTGTRKKKKVLRYVCCGTHNKFLMTEAQQIT